VNWLVLAALIRFALGYGHGPVLDPIEPLTPGRRVVGIACLALLGRVSAGGPTEDIFSRPG